MKLLKQQFMQFCKDLDIEHAEDYFNENDEKALESVLIDGAKSGFMLDMNIDLITKNLIKSDPELNRLVDKYHQYDEYKLLYQEHEHLDEHERHEYGIILDKLEEYTGKIKRHLLVTYPHIQEQQDEYAKAYVRAVEIQSAILLDRMRIMASPKETQQPVQTSISSSNENRSKQNLGYLEQISAEMKSIYNPKSVDTLKDLDALMIARKPQIEQGRQSIIQTLHEISDLDKHKQAVQEAFEVLYNIVSFMLFLENKTSPQYKVQNKDPGETDLQALVEDASKCVSMYEDEDFDGGEMRDIFEVMHRALISFGIPKETIGITGMDQIPGLIDQVEKSRAELIKLTLDPMVEKAGDLLTIVRKEDLNHDLLQRVQTFYSTYDLPLDSVKSWFENFKALESLDAIYQIMTFIKQDSLRTLIDAGPEGIQKLIQQKEQEFRTKGLAQISVDDFVLRGDRDYFMSLLVPTVVYLAACNVDDTVFSLSDFSHVSNLNLFDMVSMQKQVARLLQFDFMVHHEEYKKYCTQWAKAHNVLEPNGNLLAHAVLEAWDTKVMPELIKALNARRNAKESSEIKEKQGIEPLDPFTYLQNYVQPNPEPELKQEIKNFVSSKFLSILSVLPSFNPVIQKAHEAFLYVSGMQRKTKLTEAAIESEKELAHKVKPKSNSTTAQEMTTQLPTTPTQSIPKAPKS